MKEGGREKGAYGSFDLQWGETEECVFLTASQPDHQ